MMIANPDRIARLPDSAPSVPGVIQKKPGAKPVVKKSVPKKKPKPKPMAPVVKKVGAPVAKPMAPVAKKVGVPVKKAQPKPAPKPAPKVAPKPAPAPVPRPITPAIPRPPAVGGGSGGVTPNPTGPGPTAPTAPIPTPKPLPPPPPRWGGAPGQRGLGLDMSQFGAATQDVSGLMGGAGRSQVRDTRGPSGQHVSRGGAGRHDEEVSDPGATQVSMGYDPGKMLGLNKQAAQEMAGGLVGSAAGKANAYAQALKEAQAKFAASVGSAQVTPYDQNVDPALAAQLADQRYAGPQDLSEVVDFNDLASKAMEAERTADLAGDTGGLMQLLSDVYGSASAEDAALAKMYGAQGLGTIASGYGDATGTLSDVFDESRQLASAADSAIGQEAHKYATQPTVPLPPLPVPAAPVVAPPVAAPPVPVAAAPKPAAPKPAAPKPAAKPAAKPAPKPVSVSKPSTKKPPPAPKKTIGNKARPVGPAPAQKTQPKAPSQAPTKPVYSPPAGTGINEPGDGSYRKPRRFPF